MIKPKYQGKNFYFVVKSGTHLFALTFSKGVNSQKGCIDTLGFGKMESYKL